MDHNFVVNIDSIDTFSKGLNNKSKKMEEILEYLIQITKEMNDFFDTPTAHLLQDGLVDYLNNAKRPCNNLEKLSVKVDLFNRNYQSMYEDTKRSVGDEV